MPFLSHFPVLVHICICTIRTSVDPTVQEARKQKKFCSLLLEFKRPYTRFSFVGRWRGSLGYLPLCYNCTGKTMYSENQALVNCSVGTAFACPLCSVCICIFVNLLYDVAHFLTRKSPSDIHYRHTWMLLRTSWKMRSRCVFASRRICNCTPMIVRTLCWNHIRKTRSRSVFASHLLLLPPK